MILILKGIVGVFIVTWCMLVRVIFIASLRTTKPNDECRQSIGSARPPTSRAHRSGNCVSIVNEWDSACRSRSIRRLVLFSVCVVNG